MIDENTSREYVEGYGNIYFEKTTSSARDLVISSYDIPKFMYATLSKRSAANRMSSIGALLKYAHDMRRTKWGKLTMIQNLEALVDKWHQTVVGLCLAHDKDEADRYEAGVDECLTPLLAAPIAQVRDLADRLLQRLQNDPKVPFLVWRAYEVWVSAMVKNAPDDTIRELKTDLAKEIVALVETDVIAQLPDAMVRALQWRSPEKLAEVKEVVEKEQAKGNKVRLKGRESCLFMEAGGTEDEPAVCIQI